MKAALVSFSDQGGAGVACRRLHEGLTRTTDCDSRMVVREMTRLRPGIRSAVRPMNTFSHWLGMGAKLAKDKLLPAPPFDAALARNLSDDGFALRVLDTIAPDIVNLHWLSERFVSIESITAIRQPMVWTLHDMWAFTGGCYYAGDCDGYTRGCGCCPLLPEKYSGPTDQTTRDFRVKQEIFAGKNLTIVTPSQWLAAEAGKSAILSTRPIEVIPNSIDTDRFRPLPSEAGREVFGLPRDKTLLLFGCSGGTRDPRKGFDLLSEALDRLASSHSLEDVELVVFGLHFDERRLPLPVHFAGELHDEQSLALLYSAADLMVIPSRQDNLPNTAIEAVACGLPCVAFAVGGLPDIIRPGVNGSLAQEVSGPSLAESILALLANKSALAALRGTTRADAVNRYAYPVQAGRYRDLFERILSADRHPGTA